MSGEAVATDDDHTPARRAGLLGLLRRASWNLVDQVLSAATNVALVLVVTRIVDKHQFGGFSAALLIFSLLIGIERALVGQVMGVRHSDIGPEQMRGVAARGLGTVAALGLAGGALCAGAGVLIGGTVGPPLIAVGVVMPALLMQDTCRMIFFAQARPAFAAANDAVWGVVQFAAIGLLVIGGWANTWSLVFAWGGSAAVCVLLALAQLRVVPRPGAAVSWCREHANLVGYLLPETLLTSGGLQASTLLVGGIVGDQAVGAFGAAAKLLGPLGIVSSAVMTFAMPEISRRKQVPARIKWLVALGLSATMTAMSLAYLAVLLLLPDQAGHWLLHDTWQGARSVLLPMGLFSTVAGTCLGPALVIIAMGHAKKTFRLTVLEAPLVLTLMPLGAVLAGAPGAAWGQFAAQAIQVPFWFWTLRRTLREPVVLAKGTGGSAAAPRESAVPGPVPDAGSAQEATPRETSAALVAAWPWQEGVGWDAAAVAARAAEDVGPRHMA